MAKTLIKPAGDYEERTVTVESGEGEGTEEVVARLYRGTGDNVFLVHETVAESMTEISRLVPHPDNPRDGDVPTIRESLRDHGQYRGIVVNRGTYSKRYGPWTVGAGNHTLESAISEGWTHIGVTVVDVSDDELDRILLVDNRANDLAYTRPEFVLKIIERIGDARGTGYDDEWVKQAHAAMQDDGPAGMDPGEGRYKEQYGVIVICEDEGHQEHVYEELREAGHEVRVVVT